MRRTLTALGLGGGALGAVALLRRRAAAPRERIDLYFDDGSMVSLTPSTASGERLMPLGRRALASARG